MLFLNGQSFNSTSELMCSLLQETNKHNNGNNHKMISQLKAEFIHFRWCSVVTVRHYKATILLWYWISWGNDQVL